MAPVTSQNRRRRGRVGKVCGRREEKTTSDDYRLFTLSLRPSSTLPFKSANVFAPFFLYTFFLPSRDETLALLQYSTAGAAAAAAKIIFRQQNVECYQDKKNEGRAREKEREREREALMVL